MRKRTKTIDKAVLGKQISVVVFVFGCWSSLLIWDWDSVNT